MNSKVTVIGSINMDIVIETPNFPEVGETIHGKAIHHFPGGKGANQAVAAARLGAEVHFIGAIGKDHVGKQLQNNLEKEGIHCHLHTCIDTVTGCALVIIAENDNQIIVMGGANQNISPAMIQQHEKIIAQSDVILCQLEIPLEAVQAAFHIAQKHQKVFILNPAPAQTLPEEILTGATLITPNESEFFQLFEGDKHNFQAGLRRLPHSNVLMTCGKQGVLYREDNAIHYLPACAVNVVDTTGAGDTFNGALATFWHLGLHQAIHHANIAAALSVRQKGAQSAMPTKAELFDWIKTHSFNG